MGMALTQLKARFFPTTRSTTIFIGTNPLTRLLATDLDAAGKPVSLINLDNGPQAHRNPRSGEELVLARAGAKTASCVIAGTTSDEQNLTLCRVAQLRFGVPIVIARLRLGGVSSWAKLNATGIVRMTSEDMVPTVLGTMTPSRGLARLARATDLEQVAEVELLTPVFPGQTIADLDLYDCEVVALRRNNLLVADIDLAELRRGDVLTLVGTKAAINKVRECFMSL